MNVLKICCFETMFDVTEPHNYMLNIEQQKIFRELIEAFQNKDEEKISYLQNYQKAGKFDKNILFLPSVFEIEFDKKLTRSFYEIIQNRYLNNEKREILNSINSQIVELLELVSVDLSVTIDYEDIIGFKDILELVKLSIVDEAETYLERIVTYLKLLKEFNDYKVLVIPFLDAYLDDEELKTLTNELALMEVSLFILNNSDHSKEGFVKYTIDTDLCEF